MSEREYFARINGKYLEIPKIKDICSILTKKFEDQEKQIESLNETIEQLKNGEFVKELIKRVDDLTDTSTKGFTITDKEWEKIHEWTSTHKDYHGAIGGGYTYEFTPTGIGVIGVVKHGDDRFVFRDLE